MKSKFLLFTIVTIVLFTTGMVMWKLFKVEKGEDGFYGVVEVTVSSKKGGTVSSNDVYVLSKIISGEARGESFLGQVAVGAVIVNRTKNPNFPNTLYGVVFEPGAFDAVSDGQYYRTPVASAVKAARTAINGWDPTGGALYYWNPVTATSSWIWSRPIIARIGKHVFAR